MSHETELGSRYGAVMMNAFGAPRRIFARGEGIHLWDVDGTRYVDLLAGIAVNALGHAHPAVVEAVARQLSALGHISNFFASEPQIRLAERLSEAAGGGRVFLANSGAEANEAAFKVSRLTGRTRLDGGILPRPDHGGAGRHAHREVPEALRTASRGGHVRSLR